MLYKLCALVHISMEIRSATVCALGALVHEYVNSCAIELHQPMYPRHSKVVKYV